MGQQQEQQEPLSAAEQEEFADRANRIPYEHCIFTGQEMARALAMIEGLQAQVSGVRDAMDRLNDDYETDGEAYLAAQARIAEVEAERDQLRAEVENLKRLQSLPVIGLHDGVDVIAALRAEVERLKAELQQAEKLSGDSQLFEIDAAIQKESK